MSSSSQIPALLEAQEVCIDLPGESVQCWRSSDHLKVVLRKHRDVIFDIRLGDGKSYTVQSSQSNVYNARDKKLVNALRGDIISFRDGERLHLWITRDFKGYLSLKSGGKLVMRIEPDKVDQHAYDNDPKTKAAPIIINLGRARPAPSVPGITPIEKYTASSPSAMQKYMVPPSPSGAPVDECAVVCVVEGTLKDAPEKISSHFKSGGGKSGLMDIDPNDVATRNWLYGQLAGTAAYVKDNWSWLRASMDEKTAKGFQLVKVKIGHVRGKVRFYFSGFSNHNAMFGRGGFGPNSDRIMNILAGAGNTASSFKAALKGAASSFKGNALVSFIFGSATAYAEWKEDAQKDGYDLASALIMSVLKAVLAAALVVLIVAAVVMLALGTFALTIPVIVVGALTIAAGFIINYAVEAGDKALGRIATGDDQNTDGLAGVLTPYLRKAGEEIKDAWNYLSEKFPADYKEILF